MHSHKDDSSPSTDTNSSPNDKFKYGRLIGSINDIRGFKNNSKNYTVVFAIGIVILLFLTAVILIGRFYKSSYKQDAAFKKSTVVSKELEIKMETCLGDVFVKPRRYAEDEKCYDDLHLTGRKSKIRFVMSNSVLFFCLVIITNSDCDVELSIERNLHKNRHRLKDLYFNYIMGKRDHIYEGRRLSCDLDEVFLPDKHDSTLVVGMPECSHAFKNPIKAKNFEETLRNFLDCAKKSHLLAANYTMDFHADCRPVFSEAFLTDYRNNLSFLNGSSLDLKKYFGSPDW